MTMNWIERGTIVAPQELGIGTFLPIHPPTRLDPSDRFALGYS
jgi:hypothetical protein